MICIPHDVSQVLDERNVCVRAGHHCAKPLMKTLGVNATTRASLYLYNDTDDVDALADALDGATDIFGSLMPGLEDLYREIILDHYRTPRNRGELETPPAIESNGHNPLCGDEITVYLLLDDTDGKTGDDATVADIKIAGQGCSISQSLGVDDVPGGQGQDRRRGQGADPPVQVADVDRGHRRAAGRRREIPLGDLEALQGVVKFPVRIKCAVLGWNTLAQALDQASAA